MGKHKTPSSETPNAVGGLCFPIKEKPNNIISLTTMRGVLYFYQKKRKPAQGSAGRGVLRYTPYYHIR